jgi:hypothetical protein
VQVTQLEPEETRKARRLKTEHGALEREVILRDWRAFGQVADQPAVAIVMNDGGQLISGECGCAFSRENPFQRGPCEHMLALHGVVSDSLQDLPSSRPGQQPPGRAGRDARTGASPHSGQRGSSEEIDKHGDDGDKDD